MYASVTTCIRNNTMVLHTVLLHTMLLRVPGSKPSCAKARSEMEICSAPKVLMKIFASSAKALRFSS
eukprot:4165221-Pyramimonas_sp.AAC.2